VDVTDDAKDFILRIMKKRPEERMEMRDIMHHPFITKHLNTGKVSGQIIEDFRRVLG
jgi:serine/threonine protein kinase